MKCLLINPNCAFSISLLSRHILASAIKNLYESEEDVEEAPSNCNRCN